MAKKEKITYQYDADVSDFTKNLDKAKTSTQDLKKSFGKLTKTLSIGVGVIGATAGAVGGLTIKVGEQVDALAKTSKMLDISAGSLYGYNIAIKNSGASMGAMIKAYIRSIKIMVDYNKGNKEAIAILDGLGVSIKDNNGKLKTNTQFFYDSLKALEKLEPGIQRNISIYKIFGARAIGPVNKLLSQGVDETIKQAGRFQDLADSLDVSTGAYEDLLDRVDQAKTIFGLFLADALEPIADFMGDVLAVKIANITGDTSELTSEQIEANDKFNKYFLILKGVVIALGALLIAQVTYVTISTAVRLVMIGINIVLAIKNILLGTDIIQTTIIGIKMAIQAAKTIALTIVQSAYNFVLSITETELWAVAIATIAATWEFILIAAAIVGIIIVVVELYIHCKTFRKIVNSIVSAVINLAEAIGKKLKKGIDIVMVPLKALYDIFKKIFDKVSDLIDSISHGLIGAFNAIPFVPDIKTSNIALGNLPNSGYGNVNNNQQQHFNYNITTQKAPNIRELRSQQFGFNNFGGAYVN